MIQIKNKKNYNFIFQAVAVVWNINAHNADKKNWEKYIIKNATSICLRKGKITTKYDKHDFGGRFSKILKYLNFQCSI